jgi:hypothetical protein
MEPTARRCHRLSSKSMRMLRLVAEKRLCPHRDHLLASYAASVSRELATDAVKMKLDAPAGTAQSAALARSASMLQHMKSLLISRS